MRSGGGVSTLTNNEPKGQHQEVDGEGQKPDAKCKGGQTIPIFLKKTYKMIETCNPELASWTDDGEMFTVKNPERFAAEVIPQYFDHNKFSSFARQLNFYGFRKMQAKPIRNADFDRSTAKHVTFYNEKFKRGRCDLLKEIQRSTRGSGSANQHLAEHQREVEALKSRVAELEDTLRNTKKQMEDRITKLELDMLSQMEQMMLAMQQTQQMNMQRGISIASGTPAAAVGTTVQVPTSAATAPPSSVAMLTGNETYDPMTAAATAAAVMGQQNRTAAVRMQSVGSSYSGNAAIVSQESIGQPQQQPQQQQRQPPGSAPTLPPHPKQKQLPPPQGGNFPPVAANGASPAGRFNSLASLRGLSLSRGLSRGLSVESTASAQLMRNSWEDKFFSMLMLGESEANAVAAANSAADAVANNSTANAQQQQQQQQPPQEQDQTTQLASGPMSDSMVEAALAEAAAQAGIGIGAPMEDESGKRGSISSVSVSDMP